MTNRAQELYKWRDENNKRGNYRKSWTDKVVLLLRNIILKRAECPYDSYLDTTGVILLSTLHYELHLLGFVQVKVEINEHLDLVN
ncbi:hypothetical protein [Pedobacter sp. R20-19]|uniref:hypothetical protein n=1 Tax=Pedobacter sp. R20-19 TaxID=1270196 RepID=UPI000493A9C3|nr:hypothetical protein [Pedobacter sp. R20-19]